MKRQLILALIVIALTQVGLAITNSNTAANTLNSTQTAQADEPVEQTRKNIQVLKGLPESQLFLLMNFVAVSLGVQCNHCHVDQGKDPRTGRTKWVWESDDKPVKQKAREMMRMVLSIKANAKIDFRENPVTCYTCHRGQKTPMGLPTMPLLQSGHEGAGTEGATTAIKSLPSVEQIFNRYFAAIGGENANAVKHIVMKGRREASQSRNWLNEITIAPPAKFVLVTTTPQSTTRQIINGDKGWIINSSNVHSLTTKEAVDAARGLGELFNVVKVKPSPTMNLTGLQKVGERDAYTVENSTDTKTERYYFDSQTGLLVRKVTLRKTVLMPFPEQIDFEDYRDVEGVKVPFVIRYSAIDTFDGWTRTFTEIKRDVPVSESIFANPGVTPQ